MQQFPLQIDIYISLSRSLSRYHCTTSSFRPPPNCVAKKLDQQQPRSHRRAAPSRNNHHRRRIAQAYSTSTCLSGFLLPPPHTSSLSLSLSLSFSLCLLYPAFYFLFFANFRTAATKENPAQSVRRFIFLFRKNLQESPCFEGQKFAIFYTMSSPEKKRDPGNFPFTKLEKIWENLVF